MIPPVLQSYNGEFTCELSLLFSLLSNHRLMHHHRYILRDHLFSANEIENHGGYTACPVSHSKLVISTVVSI